MTLEALERLVVEFPEWHNIAFSTIVSAVLCLEFCNLEQACLVIIRSMGVMVYADLRSKTTSGFLSDSKIIVTD